MTVTSAASSALVPHVLVPHLLVTCLLVSCMLVGCGSGDQDASTTTVSRPLESSQAVPDPAPTSPQTTPSTSSAASAQARPHASADAGADACVTHVLRGLSLKQRVGQLLLVGVPADASVRPAAVDAAHDVSAGGYLVFGHWTKGVGPLRRVVTRLDGSLAKRADGVRPFVAADQEGGAVQPLRGRGFDRIPSALAQGKLTTSKLRSAWRTNWANDLRRAAVTVNFAPVADVVPASLGTKNQPIGRYRREYGHRPSPVAEHVAAALSGMQAAGLMSTAKHFPGLGRVRRNTDTSANVTDRTTTPDDAYLLPFRAAVDAGTTFVMVSSAKYTKIDPRRKAVYSPVVMRLLRADLGFAGVIASDDLGAAKQVSGLPYRERALRFLAAGGQLVVVVGPGRAARAMSAGVVAEARHDAAVRARVDAAVRAVLRVKFAHGLIPRAACS